MIQRKQQQLQDIFTPEQPKGITELPVQPLENQGLKRDHYNMQEPIRRYSNFTNLSNLHPIPHYPRQPMISDLHQSTTHFEAKNLPNAQPKPNQHSEQHKDSKDRRGIIKVYDRFDKIELNREEFIRNKRIENNEIITMNKEEMYEELLQLYRYTKVEQLDEETQKMRSFYACGYDNCDRKFTKGWSILDHVRMHENVRPFKCEH